MAHGHQSYTQTSNLEGLSLSGICPLPSGVALPEAQDSMLSWWPYSEQKVYQCLLFFILLLFLIDTRIFSEKAELQYLSSKSEICQQYNGNHNTVSIFTTFLCYECIICVPSVKFGFAIVLNWNT